MEELLSRLPYLLAKILEHHNETAWHLSQFIEKASGGKPYPGYWKKEMYMQRTILDLSIRHDNDYIEMWNLTDDPEGKMFYIFTTEKMKIEFAAHKYDAVVKFMEAFADRENVPKELEHVRTEFYSWQRKIFVPTIPDDKLIIPCTFRIYHPRRVS